MSLWRRSTQQRFFGITGPGDLIPLRNRGTGREGVQPIDANTALRNSAVWACLRLRANLISTFPLDVFTNTTLGEEGTIQVETTKPQVLKAPGGEKIEYEEWVYSSQVELDRTGNGIGIITAFDGANRPKAIELQPSVACTYKKKEGVVTWKIDGKTYDADRIWHEKQYTVAGGPLGLSPVSYAAYLLGMYSSFTLFAMDWYGGTYIPKATLKNEERTVPAKDAQTIKERYRASMTDGDLFVYGKDWSFDLKDTPQHDMAWLEANKYGLTDVSRFFDCPADLIDAAVAGSAVTYANMVQRNLQFLVLSLAPAVVRREAAFTNRLLRPGAFAKMNTKALLRADPYMQAQIFKLAIDSRWMAPSEVRALDNRPPLTQSQKDEFVELFVNRTERISETGVADPLIAEQADTTAPSPSQP